MKKTKFNTALYKAQHYVFEMEIHADDDPEQLKKDIENRHIDQPRI